MPLKMCVMRLVTITTRIAHQQTVHFASFSNKKKPDVCKKEKAIN